MDRPRPCRAAAVALGCLLAAAVAGCGGSHPARTSARTTARSADTGGARPTATASATATATASAASDRGPHPDLGSQGGYQWIGDRVRMVHAAWHVQRLRSPSRRGLVASWIGAQAPSVDVNAPFIQVGTEVGVGPGPLGRHAVYTTFWSDTAEHYRALPLFAVHPGDLVAATLRAASGGWRVQIVDRTSGAGRTFTSAQEQPAGFQIAEYVQELPIDPRTYQPTAYPDVSPIHFGELRVNGTVPTPAKLRSGWLTQPTGYLAPTAPRRDGFGFAPASVSPVAARYEAIGRPVGTAAFALDPTLKAWEDGAPPATAIARVRRFEALVRRRTALLEHTRWPLGVQRLIPAALAHYRRTITFLGTIGRVAPGGRRAWIARLQQLSAPADPAITAVRRRLGLPTVDTIPARVGIRIQQRAERNGSTGS